MTEQELRKMNAPKFMRFESSDDLKNWIRKNTGSRGNRGILAIFKDDKIPRDYRKFNSVPVRIIRADCDVGTCIKRIGEKLSQTSDFHEGMSVYGSGYGGKFTMEGVRSCEFIYVCTLNVFMGFKGYIRSQAEVVEIPFSEIYTWGPKLSLYKINGEIVESIGRRFCNMNLYYRN